MNPYANRRTIKNPTDFYGRASELKELFTRLSAMQSCAVVGPRRIGKSSLLYQLTHPQIYSTYLPDSDPYVFAFIDLQELAGLGPDDFFLTAVEALSRASATASATATTAVLAEIDYNQHGTMRGFRRLLIRLRDSKVRLVLCLDEFEMLSGNPDFEVDFFTYLRGLCSNYNLSLVTSSQANLYDLCHQGNIQTSQFWNIFVTLSLGLMNPIEADTLIRTPFARGGLPLTEEEATAIFSLAGGHPFFLQIACYHLYNAHGKGTANLDDVRQQFFHEALPHYEYTWKQLDNQQQALLGKIVTATTAGSTLTLDSHQFQPLARQLLLQGTPALPQLVAEGWRLFIQQQDTYLQAAEATAKPASPATSITTEAKPDLSSLRHLIITLFDEEEIRDLCFDLAVDYHHLGGDNAAARVRELIMHMQRTNRLSELITHCARQRPHAPWPGQPTASPPLPSGISESDYVDFSLKIEQLDGDRCRVMVLDSPAGQDSAICQLPFHLDTVARLMVNLEQQVVRGESTGVNEQPDIDSPASPAAIGDALFQAIFSDTVGQLFFESWGSVHNQNKGLRIKLHLDPEQSPALAALPWEFLYNSRQRRFLSLNRHTPVVRYLDVQAPTTRTRVTPPLRILVAIASPHDWPLLDLAREEAAIRLAWGNMATVTVDFLKPATPAKLHQRLLAWQPHVFHFMGHGHFDSGSGVGALLFTTDEGEPFSLSGSQLGNLLANTPSLRLAVLNACQSAELSRSHNLDPFSGVATSLVLAGLPAVVAMQFPISDQAALTFAQTLYTQLAAKEPIDKAVSISRESLHLSLANGQEWGTPVLFMRISDGHLFNFL